MTIRGLAIYALCLAPWAHATNLRSYVASNGSNANPCSRAQPCADFTYAMQQTIAGGEVDALDAGDYPAFTIAKSIAIGGGGNLVTISAGALQAACAFPDNEASGICIDTYGVGSAGVTLRNLSIGVFPACCNVIAITTNHNYGLGLPPSSPQVQIENVQVNGNSSAVVVTWGTVSIRNSNFRNAATGVKALGGSVSMEEVQIRNCAYGVDAENGAQVSIRNSNLNQNWAIGVSVLTSAVVAMDSTSVSNCGNNVAGNNCTGVSNSGGTVELSNVTITGNPVGTSGPMISFVNNRIYNNGTNASTTTSVYQK